MTHPCCDLCGQICPGAGFVRGGGQTRQDRALLRGSFGHWRLSGGPGARQPGQCKVQQVENQRPLLFPAASGGQVRQSLDVTADAFSESARDLLADAGGEATLSERGEERNAEADDEDSDEEATNAESE